MGSKEKNLGLAGAPFHQVDKQGTVRERAHPPPTLTFPFSGPAASHLSPLSGTGPVIARGCITYHSMKWKENLYVFCLFKQVVWTNTGMARSNVANWLILGVYQVTVRNDQMPFLFMIQRFRATHETKGRQDIKEGREMVALRDDVWSNQVAVSKDLLRPQSTAQLLLSQLGARSCCLPDLPFFSLRSSNAQ